MINKLLKGFREGLGRLLILASDMTKPEQIERTKEKQAQVDKTCEHLLLYQFYACPFCIKVRRHLHRLCLNIKKIDAQNPKNKADLKAEGGKVQVPCLVIKTTDETQYLYESNAIIAYLEKYFGE